MNNKSTTVIIVVLLLLIIVAMAGIAIQLLLFSEQSAIETGGEVEVEPVAEEREEAKFYNFDTEEELTGTIYVSGKETLSDDPMSVYAISVTSGQVVDTTFGSSDTFDYNYDVSSEKSVYIGSASTLDSTSDDFFLVVTENGKDVEIELPGLYKRGPRLSERGDKIAVAVTADDFEAGDGLDPEKWQVLLHDRVTGETAYVDRGTMPQWGADDMYLVYLGDTGIEKYDVENGTVSTVVPLTNDAKVNQQMKIGLSQDKNVVAWAIPSDRRLHLYNITEWETFGGYFEKDIVLSESTGFYWPVFSPGGRYIALQAVEENPADEASYLNPRIVIYDRKDENFISTVSLKDYDFLNFFTDDWE